MYHAYHAHSFMFFKFFLSNSLQMYGQHTTQELQEYAKEFAAELRSQTSREEPQPVHEPDDFQSYSKSRCGKMKSMYFIVHDS